MVGPGQSVRGRRLEKCVRSVECSTVSVFDECDTCPVFDDLCVSVFDDRGWMDE